MRAARFHGRSNILISATEPFPQPTPTQLIIRVHWAGICGTDLREYTSGPFGIPSGQPHPLTHDTLPVTMGHEFCGKIESVPPGWEGKWKVGDKVTVDPRLCCRECANCRNGVSNLCQKLGFLGLSGGGGAFAELVAVEERMCHKLPESVDLRFAALVEPLAVAVHAVNMAGIEGVGKTVLVLGGGPVGVAHIFALRSKGVGKIFVSEPAEKRKNFLCENGLVDRVIDPSKEKVGAMCREYSDDKLGVDAVFDCAGFQSGMDEGFIALKSRGTYINVASWEKPYYPPKHLFLFKEITMKASLAYEDEDFRETVDRFLNGEFRGVEKIVTGRIKLDDIAEKGFKELVENKEHIKILVTPIEGELES